MTTWKKKLTRMFRPCRMPKNAVSLLESEGLVLLEEKICIRVIFRNFKAPYRRYSYRSTLAFGSFGLSSQRIVAFSFYRMIIHTAYDEPKFKAITFNYKKDKYLSVSFDASEFNPKQSGQIEMRFYLPNVKGAIHILKTYGANILDIVPEPEGKK